MKLKEIELAEHFKEGDVVVEESQLPPERVLNVLDDPTYSDDSVYADYVVTPKDKFNFARELVRYSGFLLAVFLAIWIYHDWPNVDPSSFQTILVFIEDKIYPIVLLIIGFYFGSSQKDP